MSDGTRWHLSLLPRQHDMGVATADKVWEDAGLGDDWYVDETPLSLCHRWGHDSREEMDRAAVLAAKALVDAGLGDDWFVNCGAVRNYQRGFPRKGRSLTLPTATVVAERGNVFPLVAEG
ncbi:MAG: hypothetical protein OXK77_12585 [Gemmatimonadota bacterium]|nr:hypothetical protein [Gemmatimonadota bacterium]MDE2864098.1 hypothetical protein [Gemmatimonadota bacterium]